MPSNFDKSSWFQISGLNVLIESCSIVRDINFNFNKGETIVLMGPNGSGKSTFLMSLAGAQNNGLTLSPFSCSIAGKDFNKLSQEEKAHLLTIVPQFPELQIGLSVRKYLTFSRFNFLQRGEGEDERLLAEIVKGLKLEPLLNKRMDFLSGGELKRVAIAAALYQDVPLVLFDEPFQALDPKVKDFLASFLIEWQKEKNCSYIISTHEFYWSYQIAHKALLLKQGEVLHFGKREDIFKADYLEETYDIPFQWLKTDDQSGFFFPVEGRIG